jgi:peptide chain release factor 2
VGKELARIKSEVELWDKALSEIREIRELVSLAPGDPEFERELTTRLRGLERKVAEQEVVLFLSGQYDAKNAILTIYAGAGGTESQDWVDMLLRMYLKYFENKGWGHKVLAVTPGQEAGLKNVTVHVEAPYAYGLLKGEHGVHRLVRVSPFSSQGLRHTSFAFVEVLPEVELASEFKIDPSDLRVDTYRASGPGGQYVNKTESAVRITHTPTGIQVSAQSERSQQANREQAMRLLSSRLAHLLEVQHKERLEELRGGTISAEWGNQIRSYVLHPYKMVKDHRTGEETSQAESVLEGDLDAFVERGVRELNRNT